MWIVRAMVWAQEEFCFLMAFSAVRTRYLFLRMTRYGVMCVVIAYPDQDYTDDQVWTVKDCASLS